MYMGIDVGGTHIAAGIVDGDFHITHRRTVPTSRGVPGDELCGYIASLAAELAESAGVELSRLPWIGVGCPGYIDERRGINLFAGNLSLRDEPMASELERSLGVRVLLCNDANAAAYGEALAGAAKGAARSLTVTLGTGIGGGVVMDGCRSFPAGEVGHIVIADGGELCSCGHRGCWEAYASATALIRQTKEEMRKHPESALWGLCGGDIDSVCGKTPFDGRDMGDAAAERVVCRYTRYVALGLACLMNVLEPDVVCMGGGISAQGEKLFGPLRSMVREMTFVPELADRCRITGAALGNDAGIIGAALAGTRQSGAI